jgi:hypothetical protein
MSSFTVVPAHNLQHALRQYSFKKSQHAAVRTPVKPDTYHAALKSNTFSFAPLLKKVEAELEVRDESVRAENSNLLGLAKELHQDFVQLKTQVKARLAINLKEGTHRVIFNTHPFAQPGDISDEQPLREHLTQLAARFSQMLCDTVKTIYPNIQSGTLSVEVNHTNALKDNQPSWIFQIDGFRHSVSYGDIAPLLNVAHSMHKHQKGVLDTAYLVTVERSTPLSVNHNLNMVIVFANTPEHAALTYIGKRNPHKVNSNLPLRLVELNFPRLQEHADEKDECFERLQKYYHK